MTPPRGASAESESPRLVGALDDRVRYEQARALAVILAGLAAIGVIAFPRADALGLGWLLVSSTVAVVLGALAMFVAARAHTRVLVIGETAFVFALAATLPITYFVSIVGPLPGLRVIAFVLFAFAATPRAAVAAFLAVSLPHLGLEIAIARGLVPDGSRPPGEAPTIAVAQVISSVTLYLVAAVIVVRSRERVQRFFAEVQRTEREAAVQKLLVREARGELAEIVAAGMPGRFTGQVLGGYTLGPVLGSGGLAEVYEATSPSGAQAAIKVLRHGPLAEAETRDRADVVTRLEREGGILKHLTSPNVVRVLDVGGLSAGLPYIAMERLEGATLHERLVTEGRLAPERVVDLVKQVASGLDDAARLDVVHRDVKPSNIFSTSDGTWKVLDFGLGRSEGDTATLTGGALVGTLGYVSPEQLRGERVSRRTDVHALAVVAYRALTGRVAFKERDLARALAETLGELPARPTDLADVHPDVDAALRIGMAKEPDDRYESAGAFAAALAAAMEGRLDPSDRARALALTRELDWSSGGVPSSRRPLSERNGIGRGTATLAPADVVASPAAAGLRVEPPAPGHPSAPPPPPADPAAALPHLRAYWLLNAPTTLRPFGYLLGLSAVLVTLTPHRQLHAFGVASCVLLSHAIFATAAWLTRIGSRDASTPGRERAIFWGERAVAAITVGALVLCFVFGALGDIACFLALGLMLLSLATDLIVAVVSFSVLAGCHLLLSFAITRGWLPDAGFAGNTVTTARSFAVAELLFLYAAALGVSRLFRRRILIAFERVTSALEQRAESDEMIRRAESEIARLTRAGEAGRYTGAALGRYRLGVLIGRGGSGEVYRATDDEGHEAAIKVYSGWGAARLDRGAFAREREIIASLSSPHIVESVPLGDDAGDDVRYPVVAMELLDGLDLHGRLRRELRLSLDDVITMVSHVARGLAAAHRAGIAHGDVTPKNVFCTRAGVWKVLDFGLARAATAGGGAGAPLGGTPGYMAPEQLGGAGELGPATDVFALGAVAYRALTGRPAFPGRDASGAHYAVLHDEPPPASGVCGAPRAVDAVLSRALAKSPGDRYESVVAFADALAACAPNHARAEPATKPSFSPTSAAT